MAADHFCLKWNNFQSSIITAFESLQTTEDLADVTLTCEGLNVKAHKIILSAFSSYFRTVFKENPCPHPIVILKDVLYADLLAVLNFMYHGEVLILKDQLPSFLQTAKVLHVSGLAGCSNFHIKNVTEKCKSSQKLGKSVEPATKKAKLVKKSKSNASSPQHNVENSSSGVAQKFKQPLQEEEMNMDKIKIEIEDEDEDGEVENAKVSVPEQTEVLDSQPSILARSLMSLSHVKPTAYVEQTGGLQSTDSGKIGHIPEKPPEFPECEKHHLEPFVEVNCVEMAEKPKCFGAESGKDLEIPHHSSQCGTCPHCGKIYSNQSALKYHVRLVHSDLTNMYCCHLCPEAFDYRENYKRHMVEVHNVRN